ncbi:DUF72 domain-containing protein [Salinispira pacifica]
MGQVRIGTSGWNYDHWKAEFYPEQLPRREWLRYYADRFDTVEVNNSFYHLPAESTIRSWVDTVPDHFLFSVKASRYITHMKKLKDGAQTTEALYDRLRAFGGRMGPLLIQLPPRWRCNASRLTEFLEAQSGREGRPDRMTFEFRDHSWFNDEILGILERYGAAFCIYDLAGFASPREVTADFVYIRLHGPGDAYQGRYGRDGLQSWAGEIGSWIGEGLDVYCYFDNDQAGYAAADAAELSRLV